MQNDDMFRLWPVQPPQAIRWLVEHGILGTTPESRLKPWFLMPLSEVARTKDQWPSSYPLHDLMIVARRFDCDALACVDLASTNRERIVQIDGWVDDGIAVTGEYETAWDWLCDAVRDIEQYLSHQ